MDLAEDQRQLYAEFGIAAEKAQILEMEAGNVALAFIALFVGTDHITAEKRELFHGLVHDVNSKTLGALLRSIKAMAKFDDSLLKIVDDALKRRNYLAHRFFPSHNYAIFDEAGRQTMIAELREIQATLDGAHRALTAVSSLLAQMAGRPDLPEAMAKEFIEQGKRLSI